MFISTNNSTICTVDSNNIMFIGIIILIQYYTVHGSNYVLRH